MEVIAFLVPGCPEPRSPAARSRTAVRGTHGRDQRRNPFQPHPHGLAPKGFANDLPAKEGAVLEATQGPAVFSALTAPSGPPAWKTIPSWDLVGTIDNAIPESIQLFMANRAHAHITEVKAGHLSMISRPHAVTKVIEEAAQSVTG
jgi:pimeloyl-ACP methyl ester carboxylesterase